MLVFPKLKTGSVSQYPAADSVAFSNEVLRFLDGSEQRMRIAPAALRRWIVRLELLDEAELDALHGFFVTAQGQVGLFSFTDPADNTVHSNCFIGDGQIAGTYVEALRGSTTIVIQESRSA